LNDNTTDIKYLLQIAKKAALHAGEAIMEVYRSGDFGVDIKSDQSPLTHADRAAHTIITSHLEQTGLPVLSEEGKGIPYQERKTWDWFWMVDPLDGTKEFIKRNGEFTVNIALMHSNVPVAGVIYAPCLDQLYYGSKETGVFKIEKGAQVQLAYIINEKSIEELQQKEQITIVASKSHLNEETKAFISQFTNTNLSSMGSSLKLMLLAEGNADIYPRLAPTMEWDTAAGHAILKSLNRGVYQTNLNTQLVYNKEELLNPSFIAF
jgi:3'(2'), 5'-bisphosphate nucleotidase